MNVVFSRNMVGDIRLKTVSCGILKNVPSSGIFYYPPYDHDVITANRELEDGGNRLLEDGAFRLLE